MEHGTTRRGFLGSVLALGAGAVSGCVRQPAAPLACPPPADATSPGAAAPPAVAAVRAFPLGTHATPAFVFHPARRPGTA